MKYRGNFDVDACEHQFERRAQREARAQNINTADSETQDGQTKQFKRKRHERARNKRPWQEEQ